MASIRIAFPATTLILFAACAGPNQGHQHTAPWERPHKRITEPAYVRVSNHNWSQATICLLRGETPIRLGNVGSMKTKRLEIPATHPDAMELRIRVRLLGSRDQSTSHHLLLESGQEMTLEVENYLLQTSYRIVGEDKERP
jgi:hypothetical protein